MDPPEVARHLFAPLGGSYERWAAVLGLGQDGRWRRHMVEGLGPASGGLALDLAAGTGSITRVLEANGWLTVALDQSREMLAFHRGGLPPVTATAEALPFPDDTFDAVVFGYLLRYVDDVPGCLVEMARVLKPGGKMGMVEFGLPRGVWRPPWMIYTGLLLPVAGRLIGSGWDEAGGFLRRSIEGFHRRWPLSRLTRAWETAGLADVRSVRMSLGGGLVMWGTRR